MANTDRQHLVPSAAGLEMYRKIPFGERGWMRDVFQGRVEAAAAAATRRNAKESRILTDPGSPAKKNQNRLSVLQRRKEGWQALKNNTSTAAV
jgi:hypothetical protein